MKHSIILILLISILVKTSLQKDELNCDIFGQRITLGDYYDSLDDTSNLLTIGANTVDFCSPNLVITMYDQENNIKETEEITFFHSLAIDTNQYTGKDDYDYKIWTYFFKIPEYEYLTEGSKFTYKIDDSDEFTVYVPYKQKTEGQIDSIFVYGDYDANVQELKDGEENYGQVTHEYLMKQLKKEDERDFDQMLFLGDMAYDIQDEKYQRSEKFFRKAQPYYGAIPQINTYGNHESGGDLENYEYKFVNDYFYMPDHKDGKNRDFEFDTINAQFIDIDAKWLWYDEDKKDIDKVITQLESQLKKAVQRREEKPWIIVYTHYPIYYTDEENKSEEGARYQNFQRVEQLLDDYKVDLYLSAHIHNYQSYFPLKDGKTGNYKMIEGKNGEVQFQNPDTPLFIVDGSAGQAHETRKDKTPERDILRKQDVEAPGGGILRIYNSTHLQYQHIRTDDEQLIDNVWIVKGQNEVNDNDSKLVTYLIIGGVVLVVLISIIALVWYYKKRMALKVLKDSVQELQGSKDANYQAIQDTEKN